VYVAVVEGHIHVEAMPVKTHTFAEQRNVRKRKLVRPELNEEVFLNVQAELLARDAADLSKQERELVSHASSTDALKVKRVRKYLYNRINSQNEEPTLQDQGQDQPTDQTILDEVVMYRASEEETSSFWMTASVAQVDSLITAAKMWNEQYPQVPDDFRMRVGTPTNPGRQSCTHATVLAHATYLGR
jgi:hypothetical protein